MGVDLIGDILRLAHHFPHPSPKSIPQDTLAETMFLGHSRMLFGDSLKYH
jgi:hypothetical protein